MAVEVTARGGTSSRLEFNLYRLFQIVDRRRVTPSRGGVTLLRLGLGSQNPLITDLHEQDG